MEENCKKRIILAETFTPAMIQDNQDYVLDISFEKSLDALKGKTFINAIRKRAIVGTLKKKGVENAEVNRWEVNLIEGDVLYIAQVKGGMFDPEAEELPPGYVINLLRYELLSRKQLKEKFRKEDMATLERLNNLGK